MMQKVLVLVFLLIFFNSYEQQKSNFYAKYPYFTIEFTHLIYLWMNILADE